MPHRCRILDEEREIVLVQQRQHAARVRPEEVAHARVEAIVDVSEGEIEMWLCFADSLDLTDPLASAFRASSARKSSSARIPLASFDGCRADAASNSTTGSYPCAARNCRRTSSFIGVNRAAFK